MSVVNSSGFNHAPFVIIRSGRVVGKAAFCRFLVIVSTIIYSSYPPEKRSVFIFCVSFTIDTSDLCPQ